MKQTFADYLVVARQDPRMPKLLLGGTAVLNGLASDPDRFVDSVAGHFGW